MYAQALIDTLLDGKTAPQGKKVADNFAALLKKNGDTHKIRDIVFLAENLLYKKTGQRKMVLEVAREMKKSSIMKPFLKEGDFFEEKVNSQLVAGVKIVVNNDRQLDFSLRRKLEEIF